MKNEYETLNLHSPHDHILTVTLDRPDLANAINTQMGHDLAAVWSQLALEPNRYRCVILTGSGERAFCAGGDLKERNGMTDDEWQSQHLVYEKMIRGFNDCPVPMIAAVNGAAYGGGCEIALACDFAYAASHARFALTEVTLGIIPGSGGTQNLPRAAGQRRALELLLTGRPFSAEEALEWGVVNRVLPAKELMSSALETAAAIAANAPISTRQIKQAVRNGKQMDLRNGLLYEIEAYNRCVPTWDRREGVAAFNEKRKPVFRGA